MVRVGSPPAEQPPRPASAPAPLWLIPTALAVVCSVAAVVVADPGDRPALALCLAVAAAALVFACAEVARRGRVIAAERARNQAAETALRGRLADQEAGVRRLGAELLPELVARLRKGAMPDEAMRHVPEDPGVTPEFDAARRDVLRRIAETVKAEEDLRDAAQRAFVNVARRVQAIVHQQATDLREMEDTHGNDPDVLGDLLRLDHGNALVGRLADSIAVLGGARPGRQWRNNIALYSVLRGAVSRIQDYPRVDLVSVTEVAVVGPAVEPLIHALAELLDNATRYSPPSTRVRVTATEVQTGVAIEIEDGGVGLTEEARRRAENMLERASAGLDISDLGEAPRLGLAVVGRLARANGFTISLRASAYGGVRAVLVVPREVITTAPVSLVSGVAPGFTAPAAETRRRVPTGPVRTDQADAPVERNAKGLPQRRRRAPAAAPGQVFEPAVAPAAPAQPPAPRPRPQAPSAPPGMWLAAFTSGVQGDHAKPPAGPAEQHDTSDKGERE